MYQPNPQKALNGAKHLRIQYAYRGDWWFCLCWELHIEDIVGVQENCEYLFFYKDIGNEKCYMNDIKELL